MLAMLETTCLCAYYVDWNDSGLAPTGLAGMGILFGVLKRSVSRVLVQFVALGYGLVRPTLGEEMYRVLYLGAAYALCSLGYSLSLHASAISHSHSTDSITASAMTAAFSWAYEDLQSLFLLCIAFLDTTFYIWIFTSMNNLLVSLASRQQAHKFGVYKTFRRVLIGAVLASGAWALYGSFLFLSDDANHTHSWRAKWTLDAVWEALYCLVFLALAVLWAPQKNALRYASAQELAQSDEDEDWQAWAGLLHSGNHQRDGKEGSASKEVELSSIGGSGGSREERLDAEYGEYRMNGHGIHGTNGIHGNEEDPFQGTGALDPAMAIAKKQ